MALYVSTVSAAGFKTPVLEFLERCGGCRGCLSLEQELGIPQEQESSRGPQVSRDRFPLTYQEESGTSRYVKMIYGPS